MATVYHTPPSAPPRPAGPLKTAGRFVLGVLFLLSVLLLGWMVFDYFTSRFVSADAARAEERKKILTDRVTEDYKYLHDQPSWFKKEQGLVRVPIEEAMRMTLVTLRANQPHAAYPITGPVGNNGAPTSPDKGFGSTQAGVNPPASNPTTGHPVPTPAPSATPALPPTASPAPASGPTPAPAASAAPGPNANNPGPSTVPGAVAQPTPAAAPEVTPAPAAQPAPLATPAAQPTPMGTAAPAAESAATPVQSPAGTR